MKIGIDIHNCIDLYPEIFRHLSYEWKYYGNEIHIITGQTWEKAQLTVDNAGITYTHHFSIVDHHRNIGTKTWTDEKNNVWMDDDLWIRSKGDYAKEVGLDMHFDDFISYAEYFPDASTYVIVPPKNFKAFYETLKNILY